METLKSDDIFNFIFIYKFYENQEENYCLDLDSDSAISLAFYFWTKNKTGLDELISTCTECNQAFWGNIEADLQKAVLEVDYLNNLLSFDYNNKQPCGTDKLGLDDETKESFFGLLIREISLSYQKLDPLQLFNMMKKFKDWVRINFSHLELASHANDTEKEKDEFDMSVDTYSPVPIRPLPMPRVTQSTKRPKLVASTIEFMESEMKNCSIPGYASTYNFLKLISANQVENTRDFINYLAALQFSDGLAVWDAFSNYFHNIILNGEIERQRDDISKPGSTQSKSVRILALNLSVLYIYFGYRDAALRSLLETQNLAHLNNDEEVLQQALVWRVFLTGEQLPNFNLRSWRDKIFPSEAVCLQQQLQLKHIEQMATNNEPWEKIYNQLYSWLPCDSTTSVVPLINCIMLKATIYEMYGFCILAELCAQQALSVSIHSNSFASHFDLLAIQSNAAEMVLSSVKRCSDSLYRNIAFIKDLETMSAARDQIIIYQNNHDGLKSQITSIEDSFARNDWESAKVKIANVKAIIAKESDSKLRYHNYNSVFLDAKIKILEGRISETGLNYKIPYALMDGLALCKTNRFRSLEMYSSLELGKYWLSQSKIEAAGSYLTECEEQMLLNIDLVLQRSHFLHLLTVKLLELKRDNINEESFNVSATNIHDELDKLIHEFSRRDDHQNLFLKNKARTMLLVVKHLLNKPQHEIIQLESSIKY